MNSLLESIGQQYGLFPAWLATSMFIFLRYALPAALVFFVVYRLKRQAWFSWKIQQKFPNQKQIHREIGYGIITSFIYGGLALSVYFLRKNGYGALYFDITERGWTYYIFSIILMIFAHDAYFYWIHRLMHHPSLFKHLHLVHHQSINPTPFTSFSFHPLESILEFAIVPLLAIVLPMHFSALLVFTIFSIVFNIVGHTGYEISPSGFTRHWLFKWVNTPTHHNMHHSLSKHNYGLYFNLWDRLMGTNSPDYDQTFESVKSRTREQVQTASVGTNTVIKTGITILLIMVGTLAVAQINYKDIKNGQYGAPEERARQADEMMQKGLHLREDQIPKIREINLRYAKRSENEVVKQKMSDWSKSQKLKAIQKDKDAEIQKILDADQFEKYRKERDRLYWAAIKDYFF